jgi:acyl-CoA reductase-like NAD-dependent aldehyde dehydrogenase
VNEPRNVAAPIPFYVAGVPRVRPQVLEVRDPATGALVATVCQAGPDDVESALAAAVAARRPLAQTPVHRRKAALEHLRDGVRARSEELARTIALEAGKPITWARGEVARAGDTFDQAVAECTRPVGELLPVDASPRSDGYLCMWRREPIGVVSLITPFNFPLNLVAHKIAPALVAGCPFVLKPALETPLSALALGDLLCEAVERFELPPGTFSILPADNESAAPLVDDARVAMLSFTGSASVGWELEARATRKRVALELGGNAACIVDADADLDDVVERLIGGMFAQAGQSCISVQRVLVHDSLAVDLERRLDERTRALRGGSLLDDDTFLAPVLRDRDAERIESWIAEAVQAGARVVCGGTRSGRFVAPTLLADVDPRSKVVTEEVFGPVATLEVFADFDEAVERANSGPFGLQVGLFTRDWQRALRAFERLDVGGVVLGDIPTARADLMPYGGRGASGTGREGVHFAVQEMTEPKVLLVRRPAPST